VAWIPPDTALRHIEQCLEKRRIVRRLFKGADPASFPHNALRQRARCPFGRRSFAEKPHRDLPCAGRRTIAMPKTLKNRQKHREKGMKIDIETATLAATPKPSPDETRLPKTESALENP
jgi:hypothetical protein